MNNEQARPTSQPTPSVASGKEDYRKYIARKRRQRRKQRRLILCAAAMLVLVLLVFKYKDEYQQTLEYVLGYADELAIAG